MGKVTDIDAGRPHIACVALCCLCVHEWAAVLPESAEKLPLECPKCHQMSGRIEHIPFLPKKRIP